MFGGTIPGVGACILYYFAGALALVGNGKLELGPVHRVQQLLDPRLENGSVSLGHLGLEKGREQEPRPDVECPREPPQDFEARVSPSGLDVGQVTRRDSRFGREVFLREARCASQASKDASECGHLERCWRRDDGLRGRPRERANPRSVGKIPPTLPRKLVGAGDRVKNGPGRHEPAADPQPGTDRC